MFKIGYTSAPVIMQHELTSSCNNNCGFCYNPERCLDAFQPRQEKRQLNLDVAKQAVARGVMAACLTGGEPLLVGDHLYEVLDIYAEAGCYTSINSNGRLATPEVARKLHDRQLKSALVSLHGFGELHDIMVGDSGAFAETMLGISNLTQAGISVVPNFVATARNLHGLLKAGEKVLDLGLKKMTVTPFLPSHGAANHDQFLLNSQDYRNYFETILRLRHIGLKMDSTLPIPPCVLVRMFPGDWLEFLPVLSPRVCMAGRSFGVVSPDGYFRACIQAPFLPEYGGEVAENFAGSWGNANHWAETGLMPYECRECAALSVCGAGCRTGCMWQNHGQVCGKTMYMGEPLQSAEADPFMTRAVCAEISCDDPKAYRLKANVRCRDEEWGQLIFVPGNQCFTILSKDKGGLKQGKSYRLPAKTSAVLQAMQAVEVADSVVEANGSLPLPSEILLPRLGNKLTDDSKVFCLRADTGERYFF